MNSSQVVSEDAHCAVGADVDSDSTATLLAAEMPPSSAAPRASARRSARRRREDLVEVVAM